MDDGIPRHDRLDENVLWMRLSSAENVKTARFRVQCERFVLLSIRKSMTDRQSKVK